MPVLLEEKLLSLEFSDLHHRRPIERPTSPLPRAATWHQSGILTHIAEKIGALTMADWSDLKTDGMPWAMAMGVMWEEFYFSLRPDVSWQPGEVVEDEIACNCDGLSVWQPNVDGTSFDDEVLTHAYAKQVTDKFGRKEGELLYDPLLTVEETKCTVKRMRTGEEFLKEWYWQHQGRAYCHVYGSQMVRWTILYYRGNWKDVFWPAAKQYLVWFSEEEVRQTWGMLLKHRDQVEKEGGVAA